MKFKALYKFLICLIISIQATCGLAFADDTDPSITLTAVKSPSGNEVSVSVSANNNPGFAILNIDMSFDSEKLIPVSVTRGNALPSGDLTNNLDSPAIEPEDLEIVRTIWQSEDNRNIKTNGVLYTVEFRIVPGTKGVTGIGVTYAKNNPGSISNSALDNVPFSFAGVSVSLGSDIPSHTVTFKDYDGTVLKMQADITAGTGISAPEPPNREGYTFTGWDKAFDNITSDLTIFARYEPSSYTVTFKDFDGSTLKAQTVQYGFAARSPNEPVREGHVFIGWDKDFSVVKGDMIVTATYQASEKYTVIFKDYDGTVLKTQKDIAKGTAASAPTVPSRAGYDFTGWDKDFLSITSNLTVTAKYTAKSGSAVIDGSGGEHGSDETETGISEDLIISADDVKIRNYKVAGNVIIYGNTVNIRNISIGGNLIIYGTNVDIVNIKNVKGNVSIYADNTYITNASIDGDITVEKSVADGEVTLKGISAASSTVYIKGGGSSSVIIEDSRIGAIEIDKPNDAGSQPVSVKALGDVKIDRTKVKSPSKLINLTPEGNALGEINLSGEIPSNSSIVLDGVFSSVSVSAGNISVELPDDTVISELSVARSASAAFLGGGEIGNAAVDGQASVTFANSPQNESLAYTITASAGEHGSITPDGEVPVAKDGNKEFVITPDTGYEISSVTVDGENKGTSGTYTFNNVTAPHTVTALFVPMEEKEPVVINYTNSLAVQGGVISGGVEVSIENNTGDVKPAVIVLAIYDGSGKLIYSKSSVESLAAGVNPVNFGDIGIPNATAGMYSVKIMCWESLSGMKPLAPYEAFELK